MGIFTDWFREKDTKVLDLNDALESAYFFESFDSHYEITEIKKVDVFTFYGFSVNNTPYRIFIEDMQEHDMIHIGFEKYDFDERRWRIEGIDNELKNGEVQKIFGTMIHVVKYLYKGNYNNILFGSDETKKFRVYLRLVSQISKKLLPDSIVSHNERSITITKEIKPGLDLSNIITKYKPKK